jgi:LPXTG-motif cell wall-anchored protein
VYLTVHSPTRMDVSEFSNGSAEGDLGKPGGTTFESPTVQASGDSDTDGPWTGPGVYFLSVQAVYRGSQLDPPRAEIPFHFTVSLVGAVQPTPTPTAVHTATPSATPRPTATPSGTGKSDSHAAAAAGAGVAGLLLGVIAGIFRRRRRR